MGSCRITDKQIHDLNSLLNDGLWSKSILQERRQLALSAPREPSIEFVGISNSMNSIALGDRRRLPINPWARFLCQRRSEFSSCGIEINMNVYAFLCASQNPLFARFTLLVKKDIIVPNMQASSPSDVLRRKSLYPRYCFKCDFSLFLRDDAIRHVGIEDVYVLPDLLFLSIGHSMAYSHT